MANTIQFINSSPFSSVSPMSSVSGTSVSSDRVFVHVRVTVDSNSGGAIPSTRIGLANIDGGLASTNATVAGASITTPDTTGDYDFLLTGKATGVTDNS